MADAIVTSPKDAGVLIKLYPKDLAEVMFQAAQKPEVLKNLQPFQIDRILFELNAEHQNRNQEKTDEPK